MALSRYTKELLPAFEKCGRLHSPTNHHFSYTPHAESPLRAKDEASVVMASRCLKPH